MWQNPLADRELDVQTAKVGSCGVNVHCLDAGSLFCVGSDCPIVPSIHATSISSDNSSVSAPDSHVALLHVYTHIHANTHTRSLSTLTM